MRPLRIPPKDSLIEFISALNAGLIAKPAFRWTDARGQKYFFRKYRGKYHVVRLGARRNPDTPAQHANRSRWRATIAAWKNLSPAEKGSYGRHPLAQGKNHSGFSAFVSLQMRALN